MAVVNIGLLGLGTVGGGTVSLLSRNSTAIAERAGAELVLTQVAAKHYDRDNIAGFETIKQLTTDADAVVSNPEIDIVIELIGGYTPAKELVLKAIANGKHVVTANKALIAVHGNEIFTAAEAAGVTVAFEASVAGGIPIIKAVCEGLAANQLQSIAGIINGTGNYILTAMERGGRSFAEALAAAQDLGYAEADPSFDIEGTDAAHKLTILSALAFNTPLQFDKTYIEGITAIDRQDVHYAAELGYRIKHLGIAKRTAAGIEQRVHPTLIPTSRLIAKVDGVMNAVLVTSDAVGDSLYYGAGAGALPTASAVIADVIDIINRSQQKTPLPWLAQHTDTLPVLPMAATRTAYYLRMSVVDKPGVLADITDILANCGISIEAIVQKQASADAATVPIILLTQKIKEQNMDTALAKIAALETVASDVVRIRAETL